MECFCFCPLLNQGPHLRGAEADVNIKEVDHQTLLVKLSSLFKRQLSSSRGRRLRECYLKRTSPSSLSSVPVQPCKPQWMDRELRAWRSDLEPTFFFFFFLFGTVPPWKKWFCRCDQTAAPVVQLCTADPPRFPPHSAEEAINSWPLKQSFSSGVIDDVGVDHFLWVAAVAFITLQCGRRVQLKQADTLSPLLIYRFTG